MLQLQGTVAQPLVVPQPDRPLAMCEQYECVWTSSGSGSETAPPSSPGQQTVASGSLDAMAAARGVSVWSPQPPAGYVKLGDVLTPSGDTPMQKVAAVAINRCVCVRGWGGRAPPTLLLLPPSSLSQCPDRPMSLSLVNHDTLPPPPSLPPSLLPSYPSLLPTPLPASQ